MNQPEPHRCHCCGIVLVNAPGDPEDPEYYRCEICGKLTCMASACQGQQDSWSVCAICGNLLTAPNR